MLREYEVKKVKQLTEEEGLEICQVDGCLEMAAFVVTVGEVQNSWGTDYVTCAACKDLALDHHAELIEEITRDRHSYVADERYARAVGK